MKNYNKKIFDPLKTFTSRITMRLQKMSERIGNKNKGKKIGAKGKPVPGDKIKFI